MRDHRNVREDEPGSFKPGDLVVNDDTDEFIVWSNVRIVKTASDGDVVVMGDRFMQSLMPAPRNVAIVVCVHPGKTFRSDTKPVYVVGNGYHGWTWSRQWVKV